MLTALKGPQFCFFFFFFFFFFVFFFFFFFLLLLFFTITSAGVVPCDSPKKSPQTSHIVQIILFLLSFEISEEILRNWKFIIGLESFSNQR